MKTQVTESKKDVQSKKSVQVMQTIYYVSANKITIYLDDVPAGKFVKQENGDVAFMAYLLGDGDNLNRFMSKLSRAMDGNHNATWATVVNWLEKSFNNTSRIVLNENAEFVVYEKAQVQVEWRHTELSDMVSTKLSHDEAKQDLILQLMAKGDFNAVATVANSELTKTVTGAVAESELRDPLTILEA